MVAVYSQAEARNDLFEICRKVRSDAKIVCVKDKTGQRFMTICPNKRRLEGPTVDISLSRFKDEFSKFSTLVRLGVSFRILMKSGEVFARKHTSYEDPLYDVLVQWQNKVVEEAMEKFESKKLLHEIIELKSGQDELSDSVRKVIQGVARISIGHKPYALGELDA